MKKRIAIHSVPRSGSTWLGSIFDSHPNVIYKFQPLFSYALKDYLGVDASKEEILDFFLKLESTKDDFLDQNEAKEKKIVPDFFKENTTAVVYKEVRYHHLLRNMLEKDDELIVIGLVRNPLAVIHSWLNAPKEFKKELGWKVEEEWRNAPKKNANKLEEFNGFEKWKEVTLLFEQLEKDFPERFYLVRYDDLLQQTTATVKDLFKFAGLPCTRQTKEFLKASRSSSVKDAYGVFKKKEKDDKWKKELPRAIIKSITSDLQGRELAKYLIK